MIWLITGATQLAILGTIVGCPTRRRGRGRHVSRPLGRRLRWTYLRVWASQIALLTSAPLLTIADLALPCIVVNVAYLVWSIDDWITGDDDEPRRKHEWAKVKLRMPKPIKLRAAERFPAPAPG
jgi:hypothetical protein